MRKEAKEKMGLVLNHYKEDLKQIRTGKANPGILDNVFVSVYGSDMRLREIAQITTPEPRLILITPFDRSNTSAIAKAIEKANLNINPIADGNVVRLMVPPMDEAARKEMVKLVHRKKEECKVGIRNTRRDLNDKARKNKQDGLLTEDVLKRMEKEIQEETDAFCKMADELAVAKEKEVMTI